MDSEIKNLKQITKALDQHENNCEFPALAILMNPFEVDRLDWDDIKGVPIESDKNIPTGRFRIMCSGEEELDARVEAVAEKIASTA